MITKEQLERDIEDVREAIRRQDGCADKTCFVCKSNARRGEAAERIIELARIGARTTAPRVDPGGMSLPDVIAHARATYGVEIDETEAAGLLRHWTRKGAP